MADPVLDNGDLPDVLVAADGDGSGRNVQLMKLVTSAPGQRALIPADGTNGLDVDVTRVTPGTAPTSLAKAVGGSAGTGHAGVAILGVRRNSVNTLPETDGQYAAPSLDSAGRVIVQEAHHPLSFLRLTPTTTALGLTVPEGARSAMIQVEVADVRWRDDGPPPTAGVGMLLGSGAAIIYTSPAGLAAIRFIAVTGTPVVNVAFYR